MLARYAACLCMTLLLTTNGACDPDIEAVDQLQQHSAGSDSGTGSSCAPGTGSVCGGGGTCGDGYCAYMFEDCDSCPADCGECPPSCGEPQPPLDTTVCGDAGDGASCADLMAKKDCLAAACAATCPESCVALATGDEWTCTDGDGEPVCISVGYYYCPCPGEDPYDTGEPWTADCYEEPEPECHAGSGNMCGGGGTCGDGYCAYMFEDCQSCPGDCGTCPPCGDADCDGFDDCSGDPVTHVPGGATMCGGGGYCGDGYCASMWGEDCASCGEDCCPCTDNGDCWTSGWCSLAYCDQSTGTCAEETCMDASGECGCWDTSDPDNPVCVLPGVMDEDNCGSYGDECVTCSAGEVCEDDGCGGYYCSSDSSYPVDAGVPDSGPPPDACVPETCESLGLGDLCGTYDDGCGGVIHCGECECGWDLVPAFGAQFTANIDQVKNLPLIGWKVGGGLDVSLSGELDPASCADDCKSTLTIAGSGTAKAVLYDSLDVGLEGTYKGTSEYCKECDEDTCKIECTELTCEHSEISVKGSATYTKFLGMKKFKFGPYGPVTVSFKCGANLEVEPHANLGGKRSTPGTCQPCPECLEWQGGAGLEVGAKATCAIDLKAWKWSRNFGCKDCAHIFGAVDFGAKQKTGDCDNEFCWTIKGEAGVNVYATGCVGYGWFKGFVSCGGKAKGWAEYDSCGSDKPDYKITGWCNVKKGCPSNCVCCDGTESPSCTPEQGSWGGCCGHHGGVCDPRCMP